MGAVWTESSHGVDWRLELERDILASATFHAILATARAPDPHLVRDVAIATTLELSREAHRSNDR